jgi:uncharacterized protein (DUF1697 family)
MTERYIVLLRAINVGGNNVLPMRELTRLCVELGGQNVKTYIQSGNVALDLAQTHSFARDLQAAVLRDFALKVPVVMRKQMELQETLANNPWPERDLKFTHVAFLADLPTPVQVAALDPNRSPPDEFQVRGRDVYLHLASGVGGSKLTNAWLDSKLQTVSTMRNWRTVETLAGF